MPLQNFTGRGLTDRATPHSCARCIVPGPTGPVTTTLFQVAPNAASEAAPATAMSGLGSGSTSMPSRW
jgi:hypothetical protein